MINLVVVNNIKDWNLNIENVEVVPAKIYLTDSKFAELKNARIYNLCRSYRYQSIGYYVSLLAEARGHKIFPKVSTIQDMKSQSIIKISSDELDQLIQRNLAKLKSKEFTLSIYFGNNIAKQYEELSKQLHNLFPLPLLRATFTFNKKWVLQTIVPIALNDIPEHHRIYAINFAKEYFSKKQFRLFKKSNSIYDLAILVNPQEPLPPSNKKAITSFVKAAEAIGLNTDIITKEDFSKIPEFDALFIRETTAVNHHTYRFARRAEAEGLVVIDDPASIVKCTNKVYLAELLTKAKVPRPKTLIIHKDNRDIIASILGLPCVLKRPDSSFSHGVIKVSDKITLNEELDNYLSKSELIIAQEFMPTEFDWRISILNKTPVFACKYYMAKDHWQIYNWRGKANQSGDFVTLAISAVPEKIIKTALRAANLIGDGFYGVDLKEKNGKVYVVEINDNPNIDAGIEDGILKDSLYMHIMKHIMDKIKIKKANA